MAHADQCMPTASLTWSLICPRSARPACLHSHQIKRKFPVERFSKG